MSNPTPSYCRSCGWRPTPRTYGNLPDPDGRRTAGTDPDTAALVLSDLLRRPGVAGLPMVGVRLISGSVEGA